MVWVIPSRKFSAFFAAFLLLLLSGSHSIVAQKQLSEDTDQTAKSTNDSLFQPKDIFQLEFASDAQISPDGSTIVYRRNWFDIMNDRSVGDLWMINAAGKHLPMIESATSPRWSPDGTRLAYVGLDRNGKRQLFCHWFAEDRSTALTHLTESPSGITWSPDGKQIAFFMSVAAKAKPFATLPAKPKGAKWADPPKMITKLRYRSDGAGFLPDKFSHLFVVSADGGSPRQLTTGDFNHNGTVAWTSDSKEILISANRHEDHEYQPNNSEIYRVRLADRSITAVTDRVGPDGSPAISDDGKTIAFVGYDDKFLGNQTQTLYVMDSDGGNKRKLLEFDRSVGSPKWSNFHKGFLFTYVDQGNAKLAVVSLDGEMKKLADNLGSNCIGRPYAGPSSFTVADNGAIAFCVTTPMMPGELARLDEGDLQVLTHLNNDLLEHKVLGEVTEQRFPSSAGELEIQSWIMVPPNFDPSKKYPLILEIHGGPFAAYGDVFSAELQLMASAGYVVLYVNPRGSTSYGQDFANEIHHNYPGQDYDDLMSAVDTVIANGYVDKDRLYVTGGSGGGVLTAWIIGSTNRFKAAVVAKPVINWYSFALTSDAYNFFYKYWFPGLPWDHTEHYMKRSPISKVGNVETPTMLLTGEADYRTPISESEQYYQALKLRKIDAAMVRIPGASHGIAARPSHLLAKVAYILKWFATHP
ncbi:S9 family peptidase [Mariniblastus fucicola]|uniref:Acyl-peptide hydrolase n=1 Tax=Mariniblastus fucicola TaxID=980251 RepID=A0A5B9PML5_9BACT|nr:S9 family peptidase [Mariniblastus fucicola]QEG23553.1 Prolyl tripeptidyl peptidase precursor [Mariniblastus fucicola]